MSEMSLPFDEPWSAMTLAELREWLQEHVVDGCYCPGCGQYAKVYRRKINSGMGRSLIVMYRCNRTGWVHLPTQVGSRSREEGKLAYWGLVEEATEPRDDGGRAGWWRVTDHGEDFLRGRVRVPTYAHVYNGRCLELDHSSDVGIRDVLGTRFNYDELMAGV